MHFTTWLQKITPDKLLGRVMSVLMLMSLGLVPIADAIMGFAIDFRFGYYHGCQWSIINGFMRYSRRASSV